jgi:hypothetical protein
MLNNVILELSINLSILDVAMHCEESFYLVSIMFWPNSTPWEMHRKFSAMSCSSSVGMLCKVMQHVIICHSTFGFQYSAGPQTMAKLFTIVNAYKMVSSSNK